MGEGRSELLQQQPKLQMGNDEGGRQDLKANHAFQCGSLDVLADECVADSEERRRWLARVGELLEADRGLQQLTSLET